MFRQPISTTCPGNLSQQHVPAPGWPDCAPILPPSPLHQMCPIELGEPRLCDNMPGSLGIFAPQPLVHTAVHPAPRTECHTKRQLPCTTAPGYTWCVRRGSAPHLDVRLESPVSVAQPGLIGVALAHVICRVTISRPRADLGRVKASRDPTRQQDSSKAVR